MIGANIGDGCTITDNWIVKLEVADLDFAEAFNDNLAALFSRTDPNKILVHRFKVDRLPMYVVRYSCKQLVRLLRLPLRRVLEIAFAYPCEFLRGFFDAEGHVDVGIGRYLFLSVGAENSDRSLLRRVKQLLEEALEINCTIHSKRKAGSVKIIRGKAFVMRRTSYSLIIAGIEDVKRFARTVNFSIHRKAQKLRDVLSIITSFAPKDRQAAWKRLYNKQSGEWIRKDSTSLPSSKGIKPELLGLYRPGR
ncbi:MAG TPA: LAGLIDADG family homing endonuclease [Nitrososphaerales archaeon]|nr:LAGLIDADG family homing endonuclease [Nitrososphaerales archaeon]